MCPFQKKPETFSSSSGKKINNNNNEVGVGDRALWGLGKTLGLGSASFLGHYCKKLWPHLYGEVVMI